MPQHDSPASVDSELDITSEYFDPLRALYAPSYRISEKQPKVIYQNLAAFESAFKRFGITNLNKRNVTAPSKNAKNTDANVAGDSRVNPFSSKKQTVIGEEATTRRFEPHQMPIKCTTRKTKHMRELFTYIDTVTGPMVALKHSMKEQKRLRVLVRHEHGIRGSLEGSLICFDKYWNLWMRNVEEVCQRRKYKYGVNKICGEPQDCTWRLQELGIELPVEKVKSLNRKNVEVRRRIPQLFVRGEQVAVVIILPSEENTAINEKKP